MKNIEFDGFCSTCHFKPCVCTVAPIITHPPTWTPEPTSPPSYPAVEPEPPLTHDEIRRLRRLLRRSR